MTFPVLLVLSLTVLGVSGDACEIRSRGLLEKFNGDNGVIKVPCKFHASTFSCQGYTVRVAPGMATDQKFRFYTNTMWVSISKDSTDHYWHGRTSALRMKSHFKQDVVGKAPFATKDENLTGADFSIEQTPDEDTYSVTLSVSDADFQVIYYAYDHGNRTRRNLSGIKLMCPDVAFGRDNTYPNNICGSESDSVPLETRKTALGLDSIPQTLMYDILNNTKVEQGNCQCETAISVFHQCSETERSQAIKSCGNIIADSSVGQCLSHYNFDPMDVFIYCLRYKCTGPSDSCYLLQEALDVCSMLDVFPTGAACPPKADGYSTVI